MDELLNQFSFGPKEVLSYFTIWELLISLFLSFFLNIVLAHVYKITHRGVSYSQSYVITMVMIGVTVSVIMLIIGSNIARAFTLVGALSIIRFRNAVKETRDVGFIFVAMAIGMACGTRFYGVAIVFTLALSSMIIAMTSLDMFARSTRQRILKIFIPETVDPETDFADLFYESLDSSFLLGMESVRQGVFTEVIYSVVLKKGVSPREFMQKLRELNGNAKVSLTQSDSTSI